MCCTCMHVSVIIPGDLVKCKTYKMAVLGNIFYYPSVFPTFLCPITTISEIEQNRFPYKRLPEFVINPKCQSLIQIFSAIYISLILPS